MRRFFLLSAALLWWGQPASGSATPRLRFYRTPTDRFGWADNAEIQRRNGFDTGRGLKGSESDQTYPGQLGAAYAPAMEEVGPRGIIVDVGTGDGNFLKELLDEREVGAAIGLAIRHRDPKQLRRDLRTLRPRGYQYFQGDFLRLLRRGKLPEGRADAVIDLAARGAYDLVPDLLSEARLLRPRGVMAAGVRGPNHTFLFDEELRPVRFEDFIRAHQGWDVFHFEQGYRFQLGLRRNDDPLQGPKAKAVFYQADMPPYRIVLVHGEVPRHAPSSSPEAPRFESVLDGLNRWALDWQGMSPLSEWSNWKLGAVGELNQRLATLAARAGAEAPEIDDARSAIAREKAARGR